MSWRDTYRTASFRGATFHVESAETSHGRRQAVHEHAQRDVPYTEDLGRKAREFSVTGYLIGADYHTSRDALIKACEQSGPGQLVHPYRGELTVVCRGLSVSESSQDGGMCRVSLTFLEAGQASFPRSVTNSVNAIGKAGNLAMLAAKAGFLSKFMTTGFPAFVSEAAAAGMAALSGFLGGSGFNLAGEIASAADFAKSVTKLAGDAMALASDPLGMADRILGVTGKIRSAFGANAFGMLVGLFNQFSDDEYAGSTATPSRRQQAANRRAMNELVRQAVIVEMAREAAVIASRSTPATAALSVPTATGIATPALPVYASRQEALTARAAITDALDAEVERTQNDEAFVALIALRAEVVKGIPSAGQDLPSLISYTPRETLPALLVAHQLYGDASRADELAARNRPRHPGFMAGGQALEVLSDG